LGGSSARCCSAAGAGTGLFRAETLREWLRGERMLWPRHGKKLWLVLTLELWLRAYLDGEEGAGSADAG
ncbi:MAG: hypothetical protein HC884_18495, partial [Chloroflexaceae bacterium]|nr:hypothetical protein [Chloroflexaceae bacterium]